MNNTSAKFMKLMCQFCCCDIKCDLLFLDKN